MRFLYTFSIRILYIGIWFAHFFNVKANKWINGRKNLASSFPKIPSGYRIVWFHCASLGEFDQGLPLMNLMKEKNIYLLVTFFSPSGYENYTTRKHQIDFACYLPLDVPSQVKLFITHFKPEKAFFVKYEFWSNIIFEAKKQGVKIYSLCTIFRKDHRFFRWYGSFFRKTLRQLDFFFVQNQTSIDLLSSIGIQNAELVGDLRFDRVLENKKTIEKDKILDQFVVSKSIWVVGSSWPVDENFLSSSILSFVSTGQIILAPHDVSEDHIREIEKHFHGLTIRYSKFESNYTHQKIIIVDCIGKLSNAYSYGSFAYVGGGFSGSLHNILEPAVFGLPVIFGPKHDRFPEAQLFIDHSVGYSVSSDEELKKTLTHISENHAVIKREIQKLVENHAGASEKIIVLLEKELLKIN